MSEIKTDLDCIECDRQRSEALQALLTSSSKEEFMPNCTSNGQFRPVQCHNNSCWCVDEKGLEIAESRVHDGLPDCAGRKILTEKYARDSAGMHS